MLLLPAMTRWLLSATMMVLSWSSWVGVGHGRRIASNEHVTTCKNPARGSVGDPCSRVSAARRRIVYELALAAETVHFWPRHL